MPGPTHQPLQATPSQETGERDNGTTPAMTGVGKQGQAQQMQGGMGNAAAQGLLEGQTWRQTGNLRGNPPLRSEQPPNKGIEEFQSVYNHRRTAVQGQINGQKAAADRFLGESGSVLDNRYWFTKVYSLVTEGELQEAASGAFYYPSYVMQCVRYFDKIYQDNVKAADTEGDIESHWAHAFEVCSDECATWSDIGDVLTAGLYRSISSLVASMQAHIRYDLPRAEAWVFQSYYSHMDGAQFKDFQPDFMSMMDVFDRAGQKMNQEIADLHHLPADVMPRSMQDFAMARWFDADMATERAETWERAQALVDEGRVGPDPYLDQPDGVLGGDVTQSDNMSNIEGVSDERVRPSMGQSLLASVGQLTGIDGELSLNPARWFGDKGIRDDVGAQTETKLGGMTSVRRAQMMRRCAQGLSLNADEDTIVKLIRASIKAGDVVTTLDAANVYDLLAATDFSQYTTMRGLFRVHYYPFTSLPVAMAYIRHCMVGKTDEWHEEMIMDILEAKRLMNSDGKVVPGLPLPESEAHQLIRQIGLEFEGGGYEGGLIELEEQLDWGDEDRLHRLFGAPSQSGSGDDRVRRQVSGSTDISTRPVAVRASMIKRLIQGSTGDDDEQAIITILTASVRRGDVVSVIDRVGAHDIASDVHGSEWKQVRSLFRRSYYPKTSQAVAFQLISTCIVGETAEWEEEMIADLICLRSDGRQLISRVGGAFEGGGFKDGLNKLEWQLDGEDQDRITAKFGSSGKWW